jgi:hypothetical protein
MISMTIYHITDFKKFFDTLDQCPSDITFVTRDGRSYDWKSHREFLRSFLGTLDTATCDRLELKVDGGEGMSRLMCYLLGKDRSSALTEKSA